MSGLSLRRRAQTLAAFAVAVGMASCAPPPDPDALMGGARTLTLGRWHTDQLDCRKGDCADWYRFQVPKRGDLKVVVVASSQETDATRPFAVKLAGARGHALTAASNAGAGNAAASWEADPGWYLVEVSSADRERRPLPYEIQALFKPEPPPPPPEPKFQTVTSEVLEVEGRPGAPTSVLIDRGQDAGIEAGQRGRLVNEGRTIATVEIQDSYPEGSRARIEGRLEAPITPSTVAEIDVPLGAP